MLSNLPPPLSRSASSSLSMPQPNTISALALSPRSGGTTTISSNSQSVTPTAKASSACASPKFSPLPLSVAGHHTPPLLSSGSHLSHYNSHYSSSARSLSASSSALPSPQLNPATLLAPPSMGSTPAFHPMNAPLNLQLSLLPPAMGHDSLHMSLNNNHHSLSMPFAFPLLNGPDGFLLGKPALASSPSKGNDSTHSNAPKENPSSNDELGTFDSSSEEEEDDDCVNNGSASNVVAPSGVPVRKKSLRKAGSSEKLSSSPSTSFVRQSRSLSRDSDDHEFLPPRSQDDKEQNKQRNTLFLLQQLSLSHSHTDEKDNEVETKSSQEPQPPLRENETLNGSSDESLPNWSIRVSLPSNATVQSATQVSQTETLPLSTSEDTTPAVRSLSMFNRRPELPPSNPTPASADEVASRAALAMFPGGRLSFSLTQNVSSPQTTLGDTFSSNDSSSGSSSTLLGLGLDFNLGGSGLVGSNAVDDKRSPLLAAAIAQEVKGAQTVSPSSSLGVASPGTSSPTKRSPRLNPTAPVFVPGALSTVSRSQSFQDGLNSARATGDASNTKPIATKGSTTPPPPQRTMSPVSPVSPTDSQPHKTPPLQENRKQKSPGSEGTCRRDRDPRDNFVLSPTLSPATLTKPPRHPASPNPAPPVTVPPASVASAVSFSMSNHQHQTNNNSPIQPAPNTLLASLRSGANGPSHSTSPDHSSDQNQPSQSQPPKPSQPKRNQSSKSQVNSNPPNPSQNQVTPAPSQAAPSAASGPEQHPNMFLLRLESFCHIVDLALRKDNFTHKSHANSTSGSPKVSARRQTAIQPHHTYLILDIDETIHVNAYTPCALLQSPGLALYQAVLAAAAANTSPSQTSRSKQRELAAGCSLNSYTSIINYLRDWTFSRKQQLTKALQACLQAKKTVENDTTEYIKYLQERGVRIFALTARYSHMSAVTRRELEKLNIDLTLSSPFEGDGHTADGIWYDGDFHDIDDEDYSNKGGENKSQDQSSVVSDARYEGGVIYTNACEKGPVLQRFLTRLWKRLKRAEEEDDEEEMSQQTRFAPHIEGDTIVFEAKNSKGSGWKNHREKQKERRSARAQRRLSLSGMDSHNNGGDEQLVTLNQRSSSASSSPSRSPNASSSSSPRRKPKKECPLPKRVIFLDDRLQNCLSVCEGMKTMLPATSIPSNSSKSILPSSLELLACHYAPSELGADHDPVPSQTRTEKSWDEATAKVQLHVFVRSEGRTLLTDQQVKEVLQKLQTDSALQKPEEEEFAYIDRFLLAFQTLQQAKASTSSNNGHQTNPNPNNQHGSAKNTSKYSQQVHHSPPDNRKDRKPKTTNHHSGSKHRNNKRSSSNSPASPQPTTSPPSHFQSPTAQHELNNFSLNHSNNAPATTANTRTGTDVNIHNEKSRLPSPSATALTVAI